MGGPKKRRPVLLAGRFHRGRPPACVWDSKDCWLYVDGKRQEPGGRATPSKGARGISIGARILKQGEMQEFFHGLIDEVRISRVARYDNDFTPQNRFETDSNTLGLYHFDEGQGDKLIDSSGNGHHGKIVGAKWVKVDR